MNKAIPAIGLSIVLLAAACSSTREGAGAPAETASDCFSSTEIQAVSATGFELSTTDIPEIETVSAEYADIDYDAEPAGDAVVEFTSTGQITTEFPTPLIDTNDILSGGVGIDGIPPIDQPNFDTPDNITYISDCNDPVVAVEVNGDARAFPIKVLISHEIVNTEIGGVPVSVTYCPLCNSALAFDRRVGARELDFGVSGTLLNSALLMYDRQTGTLWSHFTGEAVAGHYAGLKASLIPAQTVGYGEFLAAFPDGQVLTDVNEHRTSPGSYGQNLYGGYDSEGGLEIGFLFNGEFDPRLIPEERVVGINIESEAFAVPFETLTESPVIYPFDDDVVVLHTPGAASALDQDLIVDGRDVGQSGVFVANFDGQSLTLNSDGEGNFTDEETGTTWNILGKATAGELEGESLESVPHLDAFWFAWAAYRPDTQIVEG